MGLHELGTGAAGRAEVQCMCTCPTLSMDRKRAGMQWADIPPRIGRGRVSEGEKNLIRGETEMG